MMNSRIDKIVVGFILLTLLVVVLWQVMLNNGPALLEGLRWMIHRN